MADAFSEQLDRIGSKAKFLVERYHSLEKALNDAKTEITAQRAQIIARDKEIEQLKLKLEYLSVASSVKISGDDLKSAKAMIADLVREIDRCISDLSE